MYGILIANGMPFQRVAFEAPEDVFSKQAVTIIGACVERNLVYMGLESASVPNTALPVELRDMSVFEHTNGPILVIKTDIHGDPVDIQISDLE